MGKTSASAGGSGDSVDRGGSPDQFEKKVMERVVEAIVDHRDIAADTAELISEPITAFGATQQMHDKDFVSAYLSVTFDDITRQSSKKLLSWLNERVCVLPLKDIQYEGVWTMGKVIVLYVHGETEN